MLITWNIQKANCAPLKHCWQIVFPWQEQLPARNRQVLPLRSWSSSGSSAQKEVSVTQPFVSTYLSVTP